MKHSIEPDEAARFTHGLRMGAMRVMAEFESLLSKHHVFDAELTLAGIFEIAHSARSKMIGYLQSTSYLLLLPVVVTDESPAVNSSFRNFPRRQQWRHAEKCKGIAPATKGNHQVKLLGKQLESFPKCIYIYTYQLSRIPLLGVRIWFQECIHFLISLC